MNDAVNNSDNNLNFKPCYVWPNPSFPFRVYFDNGNCRIFIIENIQHNFEWILNCKSKFRANDYFLVIIGCHYHYALVEEAHRMFLALDLDKNKFYIMCNDEREKILFSQFKFHTSIINQNSWLDENLIMKPLICEKKYDSVYVARLIDLKRHNLASLIGNLALVAGPNHGADASEYVPPHSFWNEKTLSPSEVCQIINESYCGLILSEVEGASFASSEYLLCGIPVVSTFSEGGRDSWYNDYNSKIVEPNETAIKAAVEYFVANPRDPYLIRDMHLKQANIFRERFINLINEILSKSGIDYIFAEKYFQKNFFHKMRDSLHPDFKNIFL